VLKVLLSQLLISTRRYPQNLVTIALSPGAWCPSTLISLTHQTKDITMTRTRRYVKKQAKALTRRRLNAQERHERQQKQAQRDIEALHQALHDLGLPNNLVTEIEGRLRAQKKSHSIAFSGNILSP